MGWFSDFLGKLGNIFGGGTTINNYNKNVIKLGRHQKKTSAAKASKTKPDQTATAPDENQRKPKKQSETGGQPMPTPIPIQRDPLELVSAKPYFGGPRGKVFTNTFRHAYLESLGIELMIRNNTGQEQCVFVSGTFYNAKGEQVSTWGETVKVYAHSQRAWECRVPKEDFKKLQPQDRGKFVLWLNNVKMVNGKEITIVPI